MIVHNFYQKEIKFKPNIFFPEIQAGGGGFFCLGNPDRRGGSCTSGNPGERGVKKRPHPLGGGGGRIFSGITQ